MVDAKVAASADDLRLHLDNLFSRAQDRTARSIVDTVNEFASQLKPQHHHHTTATTQHVESSYDDSWARREIEALKNRKPRETIIERHHHHHHTEKHVTGEDPVARRQLQKMSRELAKVKKQKPKVIKETVNVTEVHEHHHHTARLVKAPRQSKAKAKPKTNAKLFDTDIG